MADLHIDTSNVTLMGEFKSAIEDYVQKYIQGYVDKVMVGRHSTLKNSSWDFSGDKNDTIRNISIPFDKSKEHCGVINIKLSDQTTNDPKSQMSILQVLCKYKIVQKNLFKWTELNSVRFYIIRKISTCQ